MPGQGIWNELSTLFYSLWIVLLTRQVFAYLQNDNCDFGHIVFSLCGNLNRRRAGSDAEDDDDDEDAAEDVEPNVEVVCKHNN